ncbi:MAG: Hint domain-containing protein [Boseongicola sp.]
MAFSVWARGDSSTANNASLNAQGTSTQSTVLLTFQAADAEGDDKLEFNGGRPDPDTVVLADLDGDGIDEEYTFTLEFGGFLPQSNKLNGVGPNNTDLRGEEIMILTLSDGTRLFFVVNSDGSTEWFDIMVDFPNGAHEISNIYMCYVAGTLIRMQDGKAPVEDLTEGDMVLTLDGTAARIVHVASREIRASEMRAFANLRPVIVPGDPASGGDLIVSPLHRVVVRGPELEQLFGLSAAFVAARDAPGARPAPIEDVTYVHFLCEDHVAVTANGCESESLFPGDVALYSMGPRERDAVLSKLSHRRQRTAYPCLTSREAAVLRDAIQSREKRSA